MFQLAGLVLVLTMVFGGFLLAGGSVDVLLRSGPAEFLMIAGAGLGTLLIANARDVAFTALAAPLRVLKGPVWTAGNYRALASLLTELMGQARRGGPVAIETDIEQPETSARFAAVAAFRADHETRALICDLFRRRSLGPMDAADADAIAQRRIEQLVSERSRPVVALERLADALPALGIVAAVLGVIKSLAAVDQSTAVIGGMIASALVGTFLGVFLAYGIVGPLAARFGQIVEEDADALLVVAESFSAWLAGQPASAALEEGLGRLPARLRPDISAEVVNLEALRRGAG
jgi:chemotaxis protein MotA